MGGSFLVNMPITAKVPLISSIKKLLKQRRMNFSISLPSRNAPLPLANCVHTIFQLADNPDLVELVILLDTDDYLQYQDTIIDISQYNVKIVIRKPGKRLTNYYFSEPLRWTSGKIVLGLSDDIKMVTQSWDSILLSRIEEFLSDKPDRIIYLLYNDNCIYPNGACYVCMSREAFNVLDGIVPKEIQHSGADIQLYRIFTTLADCGYNRILDIGNNYEIQFNNVKGPSVSNYAELRNKPHHKKSLVGSKCDLTQAEINTYVNNFKTYIEKLSCIENKSYWTLKEKNNV